MTQNARLLRFLDLNPDTGVTSLDIVRMLGILNTTGRISDLRAQGHRIDCVRRNGRFFFRHVQPAERLEYCAPEEIAEHCLAGLDDCPGHPAAEPMP